MGILRVLKSRRDFGDSTLQLELKMCHFEYWSHLEARIGLDLEKTHLNPGHNGFFNVYFFPDYVLYLTEVVQIMV